MEQNFSYLKNNDLTINYKKLKIKKYYDQDIIHFKKLIPKKDCHFIIETCEKYFNWGTAMTFGNIEDYRKTGMIPLTNLYGHNHETFKAHATLGYWFKYSFNSFSQKYHYDQNKSHVLYQGDEGFQILKYEPGNYYKEHIDNGPELKRKYSVIIYLNDDYQGGETFFPRQNIKVKGETGDILFFPSSYTYPHVAQTIEDGIKYVAVLWGY
jgi:Rps23 Pro-64 3,4-dihydroxylase Tpa1-like proline 4-hydroxylase